MDDYKDVFKNACLMQFTARYWSPSKAVDRGAMYKANMEEQNKWLRSRKYLINPELLGQIHTAQQQARNKIQKFALPFPITGVYLIPKESLQTIDEQMEAHKERFWEKVNEFMHIYPEARDEARVELGELYSDDDYPEDVRNRFGFEWRYLALGIPGKAMLLTGEIYEREKQKFQSLMEETRELAMTALRTEFGKVVEMLVERLSDNGSKKRLNGSMFNKLHEFVDVFNSKNLFDDDVLAELTEQAKSIIGNSSAYSIQYDANLRESITGQMQELQAAIMQSIEDIPRRKIRMEDTANA